MATRSISRTNMVGFQSISFIRPQFVRFDVVNTKPNTQLYPFFDGVSVAQHCATGSNLLGTDLITDSAGRISGLFYIPPATFNTGTKTFRLQDTADFSDQNIPGATIGSASATFTAAGMLRTMQETIDNITTVELNIIAPPPPPPPAPPPAPAAVPAPLGNGGGGRGDPLAESFFTEGNRGGVFITKLDLFFQSKDPAIPVRVELRRLVNGVPSNTLIDEYSVSSLSPIDVNVSATGATATSFTFPRPVYLEENGDFCFVILSNSNKYNVWTAEMAQPSMETGKTIFEQPFIGSLFKSENNVTWNAFQNEDIKFTLYRANFQTGERIVVMNSVAPPVLITGDMLNVVSGSSIITANLTFQHGNKTGDIVTFVGNSFATYRGIANSALSNANGFQITRIDDYSFTFDVGVNATSTGTLETSGIVQDILVDVGGTGYTAPTISITGGGGTGALATPIVVAGVITSIDVTNPGSGYTSVPTITLTDSIGSTGSGAELFVVCETLLVANLNRKYQSTIPIFNIKYPPGTGVSATLKTTDVNYTPGVATPLQINALNMETKSAVVVSAKNETTYFGGSSSTQAILTLSTNNSNVSPVIDMDENPRLRMNNFLINKKADNQSSETSNGTALAKYQSKPISLESVSSGVNITVAAASVANTWFDVYIRTSLSSSGANHEEQLWTKLECATDTNLSSNLTEFKDYEFLDTALPNFDIYTIKIVKYSDVAYQFPIIDNYRCIILAS